ncbi:MAG: UDP-N-acetylglucosamine 2-epimerase (hydrolyzing) [Muribaculaceae bacterium]|nr:UDP-N-acetylglucosamine 2-epimerase (hydrolyzing) [Muribaculaceae bacterium]
MNLSNSDRQIAIATGTRADWGLLLPLAQELRTRGHEPLIMATHAHFFDELGMTVNEIIADGFTPACRILTSRVPAEAMADTTVGFAGHLSELQPGALVILGDRFEMLGAASAAVLSNVPIVHIAGGNVTLGAFDNSIRNAISQMATLHLPETDKCGERLASMGIAPERIVVAGSPGVYNALNINLLSLSELEESLHFQLGDDFLLATMHAATLDTVPPLQQMTNFLDGLRIHLNEFPNRRLILTYPNSDSDTTLLIKAIEDFKTEFPERILTIPSLGRVRYLSAAALCRAVIGNSSSGIEETPSLGIPTLDIGNRQSGRERGEGVMHCEGDAESISKALHEVTSERFREIAGKASNPYFKENTPARQADFCLSLL